MKTLKSQMLTHSISHFTFSAMLFQLSFCHVATLLLPIKKTTNTDEDLTTITLNPRISIKLQNSLKHFSTNSCSKIIFVYIYSLHCTYCNIPSWKQNKIMRKFLILKRNSSANYKTFYLHKKVLYFEANYTI